MEGKGERGTELGLGFRARLGFRDDGSQAWGYEEKNVQKLVWGELSLGTGRVGTGGDQLWVEPA